MLCALSSVFCLKLAFSLLAIMPATNIGTPAKVRSSITLYGFTVVVVDMACGAISGLYVVSGVVSSLASAVSEAAARSVIGSALCA